MVNTTTATQVAAGYVAAIEAVNYSVFGAEELALVLVSLNGGRCDLPVAHVDQALVVGLVRERTERLKAFAKACERYVMAEAQAARKAEVTYRARLVSPLPGHAAKPADVTE